MRVFYSEYIKDYSSYTFSYSPYCIFDSMEELTQIYESGFLPYTGNIELDNHIYYMARSLRINLSDFSMGSENRRVGRKLEGISVESEWISIEDFDLEDPRFKDFWLRYCRARFRNGEMSESRLDYILKSPFATGIIRYTLDGMHAGDVLISHNEKILHYWFSFFELEKFQDLPLGKYLMMDVIRQCKERGYEYTYLGTCYGSRSLYKVRDFKSVEFFDGGSWRTDVNTLKDWCKSDDEALTADRLKLMEPVQANEFISTLRQNNKSES